MLTHWAGYMLKLLMAHKNKSSTHHYMQRRIKMACKETLNSKGNEKQNFKIVKIQGDKFIEVEGLTNYTNL